MNARVDEITERASENLDQISAEVSELVMKYTDDTLSLLGVACVLFSSSLKCYEVVLGPDGLIKFMEQTLAAARQKQTEANHYH